MISVNEISSKNLPSDPNSIKDAVLYPKFDGYNIYIKEVLTILTL